MAVAFVATGCGDDATPADEGVIAAFYPLAYAAEQAGAAGVVNLTPAGAEPHELELTARDVERVRDAALVVYLGAGFQPAVEDAVADRDGPSIDVLSAPGVRLESDTSDPHVWLDPVRYGSIARSIAEALGDASAAGELVQRLDALDREFRAGLSRCRSRRIVTSHAAFGYLAARYDLEQIALVGVTPEAEPSPRQVARLVREIRDSGATTVFAETLVSPELAETIAREAGATTAVLDPLEGLAAAETDGGADYFSVMRDNLAALRLALDCT
jgi:zinc transport system substrate-binding protein